MPFRPMRRHGALALKAYAQEIPCVSGKKRGATREPSQNYGFGNRLLSPPGKEGKREMA